MNSLSRILLIALAAVVVLLGMAVAVVGVRDGTTARKTQWMETARSADPILAGIARFRTERQALPGSAQDFAGYLPESVVADGIGHLVKLDVGAPPAWLYFIDPDTGGFVLTRKLDQDAKLVYRDDGGRGEWLYDAGDGGDPVGVDSVR